MDYGYEGKLWLLQNLTVPADAKLGDTVTLKAAVDWLVCKDICVPEDTTLTLAAQDRSASRPIPPWRRISPPRAICCRWPRPGK